MKNRYCEIIETIDNEIEQVKTHRTKKQAVESLVRVKEIIQGSVLKDMLLPYANVTFREELQIKKQDFGYQESNDMYLVLDKSENVVNCLTGQMAAFQTLPLAIRALREYPSQYKMTVEEWNKEFGVKNAFSYEGALDIRSYIEIIKEVKLSADITEEQLSVKVCKYLKGDSRKLVLIMVGPPGVGKGTVAKPLAKKLGIPYISTGDVIRNAIRQGRGKNFVQINEGQYIEDEDAIKIIRERISEMDCDNGFILDGFPRTLKQADEFHKICEEYRLGLPAVISMKTDENLLINRLIARQTCKDCGETYSHTKRPNQQDICNICGGNLYRREDDEPAKVLERFKVYNNKTQPVVNFYHNFKEFANVIDLDGSLNPSDAIKYLLEQLKATMKHI